MLDEGWMELVFKLFIPLLGPLHDGSLLLQIAGLATVFLFLAFAPSNP